MSQAEITSLATLISTVIVAALVVWRNIVSVHQSSKDVSTVNTKADDIKGTVDKVAEKVDGNIDKMLDMLADIHSNIVPKNEQ